MFHVHVNKLPWKRVHVNVENMKISAKRPHHRFSIFTIVETGKVDEYWICWHFSRLHRIDNMLARSFRPLFKHTEVPLNFFAIILTRCIHWYYTDYSMAPEGLSTQARLWHQGPCCIRKKGIQIWPERCSRDLQANLWYPYIQEDAAYKIH